MQDIQVHVQFWAPAVLYCIALWLTISIPRLRGKNWLIAFLITRVVATAYGYVAQLLLIGGTLTMDQYRTLLAFGGQAVVNILGYAILVGFVLALTPVGATGIGRMLFSFHGRLTRHTFWVVSITLSAVNIFILAAPSPSSSVSGASAQTFAPWVPYLLWLPAGTWIALATQVKRWHDRNKSGWWVLIALVPVIGWVWALVELGFLKGTQGQNRFGSELAAIVRVDSAS